MICIAIDGPSGSGKSTVSKLLAAELGFINVDTGALYRAVAYYVKEKNVDYNSISELGEALGKIKIKIQNLEGKQLVFLDGEDITQKIRSESVSMVSSKVSALPKVREFLLNLQRDMANSNNVVMDGRDIGTVVMPEAKVKIFLTASPEIRAERRYKQMNEEVNYEEVLNDINKRDYEDVHRKISPLKRAKDAILFDNSNFTLEETVEKLLEIIKERI